MPPTPTALPTHTPTLAEATAAPKPATAGPEDGILAEFHTAPLPAGAIARLGKGRILQAALSPETDRIAVATSIGVHVFRLGTDGHSLEELWFGPTLEPLHSVAFSPDGKTLATGSEGWNNDAPCDPFQLRRQAGVITLWDAHTGEPLKDFDEVGCSVKHLVFDPSGKKIAASGDCFFGPFGPILLDMETGEVETPSGKEDDANTYDLSADLAYSPDGSLLAVASSVQNVDLPDDTRIQIYRLADHILLLNRLIPATEDEDAHLAFSPDSRSLAVGTKAGNILVLPVEGEGILAQFQAAPATVHALAFSPNGQSLVVMTAQGGMIVDTGDWSLSVELPGGDGDTLVFSSRDATLLTASTEGPVVRWDLTGGSAIHTYDLEKVFQPARYQTSVRYSPDGLWLAAGGFQGEITLWNSKDLARQRTLQVPAKSGTDVVFSADGKQLAGFADGTILEWDPATGALLRTLAGSQPVYAPSGRIIALVRGDAIVILDPQTGAEIASIPSRNARYVSLTGSPDGRFLAYTFEGGTVVWDVLRRKEFKRWENPDYGVHLVFAPDGDTLAAASGFEGLLLLNVDAPADPVRPELSALYSLTPDAAFSPDGKYGAFVSGNITLWDRASGRQVAELTGHSCKATSASFSPEGARLATSSYDGTVLVWDLAEVMQAYAEENPE